MRAARYRGYAESIAATLPGKEREYLTGEKLRRCTLPRLIALGLADQAGRLTRFGAEVARVVAEDQPAGWTDADSARLDAELVAVDGYRMKLKGDALAQAVVMLAERGVSLTEAARRLRMSTDYCGRIARAAGTPFVRPGQGAGISNAEVYRRAGAAGRSLSATWHER